MHVRCRVLLALLVSSVSAAPNYENLYMYEANAHDCPGYPMTITSVASPQTCNTWPCRLGTFSTCTDGAPADMPRGARYAVLMLYPSGSNCNAPPHTVIGNLADGKCRQHSDGQTSAVYACNGTGPDAVVSETFCAGSNCTANCQTYHTPSDHRCFVDMQKYCTDAALAPTASPTPTITPTAQATARPTPSTAATRQLLLLLLLFPPFVAFVVCLL